MASKEEYPQQPRNDDEPEKSDGKLKPGPGVESFKLASFWKGQVDQVDKAYSRWHMRGNIVLRRFRDERNKLNEEGQRKMNLLWANVKIMKPAIYSKLPDPIVDRKFLDRDPTGRLSSMILERSLKNEQENNFHTAVTQAVYDRLLPGRGVVWVRYEPDFGESDSIPAMNPTGIEDELAKIGEDTGDKELSGETEEEERLEETGSTVLGEKVVFDYVDWHDFYVFPAKARTWQEVQAIGKKVYISRKEAKERFGEKIGEAMQPDTTILADTSQKSTGYSDTAIFRDINERNMVVIEIWNKSDERVYWVSPGYEYLCDFKDDPLELNRFFPAHALDATLTNDSLVPVPDYWEWQDQAIQIDELTSRIAALTKACKIAGIYDASQPAINRIFNESVENKLIPVDQFVALAEKGGLKGVIEFLPIKEIQECIKTLQEVREACKQDLDQVTGINEVMRGTTDSRETLGGIRLKNNNAGTRLSEDQEAVADFCRDIIRTAAEVMCKHFSDETLIESSGILYEEELQPDVVMREYQANTQLQQMISPPPPPQQPPQQALPAPGQAPGQPPPQGSNVVLFPHSPVGGAPGQPPSPPSQPPPPQAGQPGPPGQLSPNQLVPQQPPIPPPDPQTLIMLKVQRALKLLRKDVTRGYRIDIEVDSTIFGDKMQERQDATEFVAALGQYMSNMQEVGMNMPEAAPLLGEVLQWAVRKFRTGRDLESAVDSFVVAMKLKAKMAATNPQPNPEAQKAQTEIQKMHLEMQNTQQKNQMEMQRDQLQDHRDEQMENAKAGREHSKMQAEQQLEQERHQLEREKMRMEMALAKAKHQMEMQKLQVGLHVKAQEGQMKMQHMEQEGQMQQQEHMAHQQELNMGMQHKQMEHQHNVAQMHDEHKLAQESHQMERESLQHKATAEKKSHGLKMEQHKMKQQAVKKKAVK